MSYCRIRKRFPFPQPMPFTNGHHQAENTISEKQTIEKIETYLNKISNINKVSTLTRTPTPDYYNKTELLGQIKAKNVKAENAEVDSLESYKLKSPTNINPKPPSNYFCRAPNGTETMKKHARPVSVTIGQYVNNVGSRKEPSKLDFLNGDKTDGNGNIADSEPISSRLQNELALTLSRSNLRKKTEALDHALNKLKTINMNDEQFYARYGNNLLPLPPSITIPKGDGGR